MSEIHIHIHNDNEIQRTTELALSPVLESFAPATEVVLDLALVWERVGEIRTKQQEDLAADSKTRDNRQGWVAGLLQAIQILQTGKVEDLTESTWEECAKRFPFPDQSNGLGTLADLRGVAKSKSDRQQLPESHVSQSFPRTLSPVEVAADASLESFVGFEDATGEEPEAVVSDEMFRHATEHLSDD